MRSLRQLDTRLRRLEGQREKPIVVLLAHFPHLSETARVISGAAGIWHREPGESTEDFRERACAAAKRVIAGFQVLHERP